LTFRGATRLYGKPDEEYDLDNPEHRNLLGIAHNEQHADAYCHFTNCKRMVEERKETTQVKTALKQLESTVDQLLANGRKVTDTLIIMTKLARSEQRRYYVDPRTHELRSKDSSYGIRILTVQESVRLYFRHELARVIEELRGAKWDSA